MDVTTILIICAVAAAVLPFLWKFLDKQIAKVENVKLRNALEEVADATEMAVEAALDTTVVEAKKKGRGKLSKPAGQKIKQEVINSALRSASRTSTKVLYKNFQEEELQERVGNLVEVSLGRIKARRAAKQ